MVCFTILLNIFVFASNSARAISTEPGESMLYDGFMKAGQVSGMKPANDQPPITVPQMIGKMLSGALILLGIIFLILVVYAGITWMTAGGVEANRKKAQQTMINAAIGLIVTLLAYQAVSFVISNIKIQSVPEVAPPPPAAIGSGPPPAPAR